MKFINCLLTLTVCIYSCSTRESKLTSSTWSLKEYNYTINSKTTKHDEATFFKKYKYDYTITFFDDNRVTIDLEDKVSINLSWKWVNNKDDIIIYRDDDFEDISKYENVFYGEYFVRNISNKSLKLIRLITPFDEREEFEFEKLK